MQRLVFVRYTVKPDQIAENEALTRAVFKELRSTAPKDLMYSVFKKDADFVHVLVNSRTDNSDGLTSLPAFRAYASGVEDRCTGPIEPVRLSFELIESYGLSTADGD
jgi:hypothetical protein